jgi:hypothetical protein
MNQSINQSTKSTSTSRHCLEFNTKTDCDLFSYCAVTLRQHLRHVSCACCITDVRQALFTAMLKQMQGLYRYYSAFNRGGNLPRAKAQRPFSDNYFAVVSLTPSHQSLYADIHNRILFKDNTNLPCFITTAASDSLLLADVPHIA